MGTPLAAALGAGAADDAPADELGEGDDSAAPLGPSGAIAGGGDPHAAAEESATRTKTRPGRELRTAAENRAKESDENETRERLTPRRGR